MIFKTENGLSIESRTTVVEISEGRLVSIRSATTGEEFQYILEHVDPT